MQEWAIPVLLGTAVSFSGHEFYRAWAFGDIDVFRGIKATPDSPRIWFGLLIAINGFYFVTGLALLAIGINRSLS